MPGASLHALSVPFVVAVGSGAGLLSVLSWRAFRDSQLGRIIALLAASLGVTTLYHILLLVSFGDELATALGVGKYTALFGVLGLTLAFQRRTAIPLEAYSRASRIVIAGVVVFAGGGAAVEVFVPDFVHGVHAAGGVLIGVGLSDIVLGNVSPNHRFDAVVRDPRPIRAREPWMRPIDDAVLEVCSDANLVLTPSIIAYNIGYSREEVNRRLGELTQRGFVERVDRGKYRIRPRGRRYLGGSFA
ncbi:hypothetical protein ACNS7O_18280 (plasmid) [Haloferacaceae archaeon DSL9]